MVGGLGALLGLLGLLIPMVTGLIFDRIVPGAERSLLAQVILVLLSAYLGALLFDLAQGFALVRLQTRLDAECEAGSGIGCCACRCRSSASTRRASWLRAWTASPASGSRWPARP